MTAQAPEMWGQDQNGNWHRLVSFREHKLVKGITLCGEAALVVTRIALQNFLPNPVCGECARVGTHKDNANAYEPRRACHRCRRKTARKIPICNECGDRHCKHLKHREVA